MSNAHQGRLAVISPSPRCWFRIAPSSPGDPNIAPETAVSFYSTHDNQWRDVGSKPGSTPAETQRGGLRVGYDGGHVLTLKGCPYWNFVLRSCGQEMIYVILCAVGI